MLLQMASFRVDLAVSVAQLPLAFAPPGHSPQGRRNSFTRLLTRVDGRRPAAPHPVLAPSPWKFPGYCVCCSLCSSALPGQSVLSCKSVLSRRSVLYTTWLQMKDTHFFIRFSSPSRNILASTRPRQGKRVLGMGPSSNISTYPCETISLIISVLEMSKIRFSS